MLMKNLAHKAMVEDVARHKKPTAEATLGHRSSGFSSHDQPALLIQRKAACACGGGCPRCQNSNAASARLKISTPQDSFEQEADRTAEQMMRMPGPAQAQATRLSARAQLQRECAACALPPHPPLIADVEEVRLQAKRATDEPAAVTTDVQTQINGLQQQSGQPLPPSLRTFFEPRFGQDFGAVRVHTGAGAAQSTQAVNAHAYTVGRDIVFAPGQYAPETTAGRRLLAHELTHVVQQQASKNFAFAPQSRQEANPASIHTASPTVLQRDLARPPSGTPNALQSLSEADMQAAIQFNQQRFSDPFDILLLRDIMGGGVTRGDSTVDENFVNGVLEWQAERRMTQDGKMGHFTTRSFVREIVAERSFDPQALRHAISLIIGSYGFRVDSALQNFRVGTGTPCCGADGGSDAETLGGPHDPVAANRSNPIIICFCRPVMITKINSDAEYDGFVRIVGHELQHVPQHQRGNENDHFYEFEAFFWEVCSEGRAPLLNATKRLSFAGIAVSHFNLIPAALVTTRQQDMKTKLDALIAASGSGSC